MLSAASCTAVKKQIVGNMVTRVKREKPLTQSDMEAVARMIRTKSMEADLSESRKIYALGKVVTGLVQEYSQPLALAGINVREVTVADILGLLDTAGVIKKGEYDYLLGVDLTIFDPLEQERQLIAQNKNSLILALAQLAFKEGWSKH
jgi:hypothetical protein